MFMKELEKRHHYRSNYRVPKISLGYQSPTPANNANFARLSPTRRAPRTGENGYRCPDQSQQRARTKYKTRLKRSTANLRNKQRVDTETLTVKITSRDQTSTSPIKSALLDFGNNPRLRLRISDNRHRLLLRLERRALYLFLILRRVWRWMRPNP